MNFEKKENKNEMSLVAPVSSVMTAGLRRKTGNPPSGKQLTVHSQESTVSCQGQRTPKWVSNTNTNKNPRASEVA